MNIAAYCRVSTDKADQLNSLETQKQFFEEYTTKSGGSLVRIYADEGISGVKIKNRTEFLRLLNDAKRGLFDTVVVKDISRFARNTVDLLNSTRQLKALGIETLFLTANMSVLGNSEFVLTIFGALAQEESANTSKRVKFGKKMNAQKGRVPNMVYGYDKEKGDYFNLTINATESKMVKRIFNMYVNEGYGSNKIAQILNSEGSRTKRDCKWSQNAISRILTNEIYTGKVINGKQEVEDFLTGVRKQKDESEWFVMEKPELKIIDQDVFLKAAKLLEQRNCAFNINHERQSNKYLYSTLIKCACCGYSFRRTERCYKNTYIKWICSGRNINGVDSCNNVVKIDEDELTKSIRKYFTQTLNTKQDVIKNIVTEFNRVNRSKGDNSEHEKTLTDRLNKATKSRKKYMNMYDDELISREELKEKMSELNIEVKKCEDELKLVRYNLSKGDQLEETLHNTFKDLENILSMDHITNSQLKRLISKIVVDQYGKIDVYLKPLSDIDPDQTILISDDST